MSLRKYTWRSMQQRPGRTVLTLLSIVIGVTAAVGIRLGTATTKDAYKQMFAVVTGRATLEVDATGGGGFDSKLFEKVAQVEGVEAATPLVDRPTSMSFGEDRRVRMQILGIDPQRDHTVRDYKIVSGRQVKQGDELVLDAGFAEYLGLKVGNDVRLLTKRLSKPFKIVGLLEAQSGAAFTQSAMGLAPIERARYHFNPRGRTELIDRIQIVTADDTTATVEQRIAKVLPEGVQVHRPSSQTQLMNQTLRSSQSGLWVTTIFSLLLAAFIILNTFLMNVTERRRHFSIMRAVGATRGQITRSVVGESLLLGIIGTALGVGGGLVMAFGATYLLGRVFQVQLPRLTEVMTAEPFVLGASFGLLMAVLGAAIPAWLAGRISPLEGMNRVTSGSKSRNFQRVLLVVALALIGSSLWVMYESIFGRLSIEVAQYFAPPFLIGVVILDSLILSPQATVVTWLLAPIAAIEARLAKKQLLRHHLRTALTVGVLFIVGATGVGMANSILDNIRDVHDWYDQAIQGDYFVRAMMPDMATGTAADLPEGLGEELKKVPHVARLDGAAFVEARLLTSPDNSTEPLNAIAVARTFSDAKPKFDLIDGDIKRLKGQLVAGEVVIGSVLAQKLHLKLGDKLALETRDGPREIPICGIANEYMVGGLAVHMHYNWGRKWLGIEGVDGYVVIAEEGHREEIKPALEALCKKYDVFLLSRQDIRANIDNFVFAVELLLWLLVLMLFVVAAFGVVNTLTMNVLEQTRELGLLRIVAMTRWQVWKTILMQATIVATVSLPSGIAMGVAVAYVLNMAMLRSIGRPIDFHVYPRLLILTFVGAFLIVLVAAFFPARRATRINVVEALHYE